MEASVASAARIHRAATMMKPLALRANEGRVVRRRGSVTKAVMIDARGRGSRPQITKGGRGAWCVAPRLASSVLSTALFRADPEDYTGPRNLHQRSVGRRHELGIRATLTEVSHRAVVGNPGAAIRAESKARRPVHAVRTIDKRLVARLVLGKPLDLQLEGVPRLAEVDDLDLMADLITDGIWRRKSEVTFQDIERSPATDRPARKRVGHEVDAGE